MSLWSNYLNETEGMEVVEYEYGFMAYRLGPDCVKIDHMYVSSDLRLQGYALRMVQEALDVARAHGKKFLLTSVTLNNDSPKTRQASSDSLRAQLAAGFHVIGAQNNQILCTMEVGDDYG